MVWSRQWSVSMGQPKGFSKALSDASKDNIVQEQFRSILQATIEDLNLDVNTEIDIWRNNITTKDRKIAEL